MNPLPHFGLREAPFTIAPDPRYLYMSRRHQEALAHLVHGLRAGGGFVVLTGEVGAGKTTLCRRLLARLPAELNLAMVLYPKLSVPELLRTVCDEFRIRLPAGADLKTAIDAINDFLLTAHAQGRDSVLVIDEAQNLSAEVLEHLRLLTNLETDDAKLLQIVLIGQPELRDMLARPELAQLAQRVIARYHLAALGPDQTARYVRHRLKVAGAEDPAALFDDAALARVHRWSRGVPRRVNLLCERALLAAALRGAPGVSAADVDRAGAEVFPDEAPAQAPRWPLRLATALGLAAALVAVAGWVQRDRVVEAPAALTLAPTPPAHGLAAPAAEAARAAEAAPVAAGSSVAALTPLASLDPGNPAQAGEPATLRWPVQGADPPEGERWRELARLWGAEVSAAGACERLRAQALGCFSARLSLAELRGLDRPGWLTLHDGRGDARAALLTYLDERQATLQFGGEAPQRIALAALAQAWRGEFATLWRMPPGYGIALGTGATGAAVDRLAAQLATVGAEPAPAPGQALDGELRRALLSFQVAHDLDPDGLAGPTTFMRLNRASGVDEPRLGAAR